MIALAARAGDRARAAALAAVLAGAGTATVAAVAISASPAAAALPAALVAVAWLALRAPPWRSAAPVLFLVLALDVSSDAAGLWRTPLAALGDVLQDNLARSAALPGISLTGLEVAALVLAGVATLRRRARAAAGAVAMPAVVPAFLLLYAAGVLWAVAVGIARGQDAAWVWKARQLLDVPLFAAAFSLALRGSSDHRTLGRIVVAAAVVKALLAVWVQRVIAPALTGGKLEYATNHGDSLLFAVAALVLLADLAERRGGRGALRAAALLALVLLGIHENGRRTAWVMIGASLAAAWVVMPARAWKRRLARRALLAAPVVLLYVAVGWDRGGRLFAPVQTLRTLTDPGVDSSTRWREIENWNLAVSMRAHPVLGLGLGGEYVEVARNDDISTVFAEYRAWPHNSVLALLLFAGPLGFTALWAVLPLVLFLAARAYPRSRSADDRVAALACIATAIGCAVLAFGDTGAHFVQYRVLLGVAVAVSGKLAVATGAWPARRARTSAAGGVLAGGSSP